MNDRGFLNSLCIGDLPSGTALSALPADCLLIIRDSLQASKVAALSPDLLCRRALTNFWHCRGLLGKLALLLNPAAAQRFLDELRQMHEAWLQIESMRGAFWARLQQRSPFRLLIVEEFILMATASGWQVTEPMVEKARAAFRHIGATKIVEDGWQKERHGEVQANVNKRMKKARMWMTPVEAGVLGDIHRFKEIPYMEEPLVFGMKDLDMDRLFRPSRKDATMDFRPVCSTTATPAWYSPAPLSYFGHVADLSLYDFVSQSRCFASASMSWLSVLLTGAQSMCVRRKGARNRWYFVFANHSGVAAVGWPADAQQVKGQTLLTVAANVRESEVLFLHIVNLDDWEAVMYHWRGPLEVERRFGLKDVAIVAEPERSSERLLACCARQAFFRLPKTPLLQLAKHLAVDMSVDWTLFRVLEALVRHALPSISEAAVMEILRLRALPTEPLCDFLDNIDVAELGSAEDEREFRNIRRNEEEAAKDLDIYTKQFREFEAEKRAAKPKVGGKERRAGKGVFSGRNYPATLPPFSDEAQWQDPAFINELLPPDDSKVYKDIQGRRFQLFWAKSRLTRSSAWLRYGYGGAVRRTLVLAWQEWQRMGGEAPPFRLSQ